MVHLSQLWFALWCWEFLLPWQRALILWLLSESLLPLTSLTLHAESYFTQFSCHYFACELSQVSRVVKSQLHCCCSLLHHDLLCSGLRGQGMRLNVHAVSELLSVSRSRIGYCYLRTDWLLLNLHHQSSQRLFTSCSIATVSWCPPRLIEWTQQVFALVYWHSKGLIPPVERINAVVSIF